ncbi:MAG: roadblock/LC7 domain-containing protein [Gammaproteobacteria bacterium]|nr:roadblock/LC7 domain-containing protein [Gammaproteobacteria bacterium]
MQIIKDIIETLQNKSPNKVIDASTQFNQQLQIILKSLLQATDNINAALISSADGIAKSQVAANPMDEHRFAAMSSALLALSDNLSKEAGKGTAENVLIESKQGKIFILHAGPHLLLTVFTPAAANLGMALAHARQAVHQINALVEALTP